MKTSFYDHKPNPYEAVGNGSYIYRWNIEKTARKDESGDTYTQYSCYEVVVWGTVTKDKITEAVINALWGAGYESKLINDYNAAQLGLLDESYIDRYKTFIDERASVKAEIKAVCETYGIKSTRI